MTEEYLLLIKHFHNDDIYIDHKEESFMIETDGKFHKVAKDEVSKFITTFVDNKKDQDGK